MINILKILFFSILICIPLSLLSQKNLVLENDSLLLEWKKTNKGFELNKAVIKSKSKPVSLKRTLGVYTILYSQKSVSMMPEWDQFDKSVKEFPDSSYFLIHNKWQESLSPVAMNTAGYAIEFLPSIAYTQDDKLVFEHITKEGITKAVWQLDQHYCNDILVEIEFEAKKDGFYSISTPVLTTITEEEMEWGVIPGHFQGRKINNNLILSYAYGQGIPNRPIIVRERTATTLSPLIKTKDGITIAVIPSPGTGRDPWDYNVSTHLDWKLGLSLKTRNNYLSPVAYHPVLGQKGSFMLSGEKKTFNFRYTLKQDDWYEVYKHAIYDVYKFAEFLSKKETTISLTNRIWGMFDYLKNRDTSLWHTFNYKGLKIGAQEYNGPVLGSDKDAAKNSDYGAMWMLSHLTGDSILLNDRLPYARNFKIAQQEKEDEFFKGSVSGQYYLWKNKHFTEEWGNYSEPIALTYYVILDMANVLLFEPNDLELRNRLELGADRLLSWQKPDGSWSVAYDHKNEKEVFLDIKDLRNTFYGMLVAYKMIGKKEYLDAAIKGADWFIKNATNEGHFLGVCGDFRFAPDFATGQSAQALLDLYEITLDKRYLDASISTSRIYTTSVYTHPIPTKSMKYVKGQLLKDWEISQVGLSFEHGGTIGSASRKQGPILLASHAGMFVRMFKLTGDSLYLDMARAGVLGRDAFVNKTNLVASYYWHGLDNGPGKFPHHAWWQIGWIMDYLVSEIELRSKENITFPSGFIAPKVGPHKTYGFQQGKIFNEDAQLVMKKGFVNPNNPYIDYLVAENKDLDKFFVMLLNNNDNVQSFNLDLKLNMLESNHTQNTFLMNLIEPNGNRTQINVENNVPFKLNPYALLILEINY